MLDEEHLLHKRISSKGRYVLRRIGSHYVVLVSLPAGRIGIVPAAFLVGQVTFIFTSIRFGLIVGIGGGAPSVEADVRPGDVVVSEPTRENGRVVQYDLARWDQYQNTQDRGSFATLLSTFDQYEDFGREKAGPDPLFKLIKDGVTRDRLSEELAGVLYFEMEAAGLMNNLPGLVVRGICNYANSHKNSGSSLEQELLQHDNIKHRRVLAAYGPGGVGKTQLAANLAWRHQHSFSSIPEVSRLYAAGQSGYVDEVVKDVLGWLSITDDSDWLLVVDNIDRDERHREEDTKVYNVEEYLPETDHGSVLITARLHHLGQLGERWEVKPARAIFETWYGAGVGEEGDELLRLLEVLPLALAQAAVCMHKTGIGFGTYTRLYKEQWRKLREVQDGKDFAAAKLRKRWCVDHLDDILHGCTSKE
ncbi:Kinesin light chain 6 [Stagonosporopsis vannaccii]|nr:Kinesin light chain 6 [Stagonosporopsis vannaccii]